MMSLAGVIPSSLLTDAVVQKFKSTCVPKETGCVEWSGYRNARGYGRFYMGILDGKQINRPAHRVAMAIAGFIFNESNLICHKCDNPPCVNHEHLFVGDPLINQWDAIKKKRFKDSRVIIPFDVRQAIYSEHESGLVPISEIAERHGYSYRALVKLIDRMRRQKGERQQKKFANRLSEEQRNEIMTRRISGEFYYSIGKSFGVTATTIMHFVRTQCAA